MRAHETPTATWAAEVKSDVEPVLGLREGWDGYDAQPVRDDIAVFALGLLDRVLPDGTPAPAIVPTAGGGIQFEWHEIGWELEIDVADPSRIAAIGASRPPGRFKPIDVDRLSDIGRLGDWIARAVVA